MISFTAKELGIAVDEWCVSPVVYLDHWAWRKISESVTLAERFAETLNSREGTLAFSWLNIIEFSKVTDEQQRLKADALMNRLLPRVFILTPDFFKVIAKEDELLAGAKPEAPHADLSVLRFFAKHNLTQSNSLHLLQPQNLFALAGKTDIVQKFVDFADSVIARIETLRRQFDTDRDFRRRVNQVPKGDPIQHGTRFIANELLGGFLKDRVQKLDRNHIVDVSHAVVSVSYCDFVLLDAHWAAQVERARKRILAGGMSFPMATVFSERANGIEEFLRELKTGPSRS